MAPHTSSFISSVTGFTGEQKLIDDLVREQIKLFGIDMLYLPRRMLNYDKLLHESTKSAFEVALSMPCYLSSFDGYDNGMELLTKFGVRSSDEITLVVSRSEFTTFYSPYLKSYYEAINDGAPLDPLEGQIDARPKEGDLMYFPFDDAIFEIKYVMFDQPFFQLGKGYVFEMRCEKFEYSGEIFNTGYDSVDDVSNTLTYYTLEFLMDEGGTGTFSEREIVTITPITLPSYSLYGDAGYLQPVSEVTATVTSWDLPNRKLRVTLLSDEDPLQQDPETGDVDVDKLKNSVFTGGTSSAVWQSTDSEVTMVANEFNDDNVIQQEFDAVKILDPADESPFGFM